MYNTNTMESYFYRLLSTMVKEKGTDANSLSLVIFDLIRNVGMTKREVVDALYGELELPLANVFHAMESYETLTAMYENYKR